MCMFSAPKAPPPVVVPDAPPPIPDVQPSPQAQDPAVQQSRQDERQRRIRAASQNSTLVTGGQGLISQPATGLKTAYGQ